MTATDRDIEQNTAEEAARPSDALRALDRLVGIWRVSGGTEGTVRYEWMPGGFFLLQHVDLVQYGRPSPAWR